MPSLIEHRDRVDWNREEARRKRIAGGRAKTRLLEPIGPGKAAMFLCCETIQHHCAVQQYHDWHERCRHRVAAAYRSAVRNEDAEAQQDPENDRRRRQDRVPAREHRAVELLGRQYWVHALSGSRRRQRTQYSRNAPATSMSETNGPAPRSLACCFGCDIPHVSAIRKRRVLDF